MINARVETAADFVSDKPAPPPQISVLLNWAQTFATRAQ
jgi:hypothetical protein